MSIFTAVLGFLKTLLPLISQWVGNILFFNAGKTAADDAALKTEAANEAKAIDAGNAADRESQLNPGSLRSGDDGFSRD